MSALPEAASALQADIDRSIPLARAIGLVITAWDGQRLVMQAPLAPNVNDKGCAFGGSLVSGMTLAGWALVTLALRARDLDCDVFVARGETAYLSPVWKDFRIQATAGDPSAWDVFFATLQTRGKARLRIQSQVQEQGDPTRCATLDASFAAKRRDPRHGKPPVLAAQ